MMTAPSIQFFDGISEDITSISLRRDRRTGARIVVMIFETLRCIERFRALTSRFSGSLSLADEEGNIAVEPSNVRFIFSGPEGDDFERLECSFEVNRDDHWERIMRFLNRYAEANGLGYGDRESPEVSAEPEPS